MQKFPAETFMATTKLTLQAQSQTGKRTHGPDRHGQSYANLVLKSGKEGINLV